VVTERGKPIGQIIPVKQTIEKKLQSVVDAGLAEWSGRKVKPGRPDAINRSEKQISDLVADDRGNIADPKDPQHNNLNK